MKKKVIKYTPLTLQQMVKTAVDYTVNLRQTLYLHTHTPRSCSSPPSQSSPCPVTGASTHPPVDIFDTAPPLSYIACNLNKLPYRLI